MSSILQRAAGAALVAAGVLFGTSAMAAEPGPILPFTSNATAGADGQVLLSFSYSLDPQLGLTDISFASITTTLNYDTSVLSLDVGNSSLVYGGNTVSLASAGTALGIQSTLIQESPAAGILTTRSDSGVDLNLTFVEATVNLAFTVKPGTVAGTQTPVYFELGYTFHDPANPLYELDPQPLLKSAMVTTVALAPVPEPATWASMALGLGALGWLRRRRA